MTISGAVLVGIMSIATLLLINLVVLAVAWGRLGAILAGAVNRLEKIEKLLGQDGNVGAFLRHGEYTAMDNALRAVLTVHGERLTEIEKVAKAAETLATSHETQLVSLLRDIRDVRDKL